MSKHISRQDITLSDMRANLVFNASLVSRDERAKAFLDRNQDFLGRFRGRLVLSEAEGEILELLWIVGRAG